MSTHLPIHLNLNILLAFIVYFCIFEQDNEVSLFTRYTWHIHIYTYIYLYDMVLAPIWPYILTKISCPHTLHIPVYFNKMISSLFTKYIWHIYICIFIWHGMVSHLPICCIDLCNRPRVGVSINLQVGRIERSNGKIKSSWHSRRERSIYIEGYGRG